MSGNSSSALNGFGSTVCDDAICALKVTTICALSTLTVAGNLIVLVILVSSPSLHNCHSFLLISLSLADLITGLVSAMSIYPSVYNHWPFGDTLCLTAAFLEAVVKKASLLALTSISIERYIAVAHPLSFRRIVTKKRALICMALCWAVPIGFFTALLSTRQITHKYVFLFHSCTITYQSQFFSMICNVSLFILPSMIAFCVTSYLAWGAMKRAAVFSSRAVAKASQAQAMAAQFFRMSRIMALTFYVCWAPHVFVGLACILANVRQPLAVFFLLYWLHMSNSLWNVVIYFVMNASIRRHAWEFARYPLVALVGFCRAMASQCSGKQSQSEPSIISISAVAMDVNSKKKSENM